RGRQEDHHDRRRGRRQSRASRAGGLAQARRGPVRLLPVGTDHVRRGPARAKPPAHRRRHRQRDERQRMPLRHVCAHPRRHPRSRARAGLTQETFMHPLVRSHVAAVMPVRNVSRRRFMQGAGGLVLGFTLGPAAVRSATGPAGAADHSAAFAPNAFVRIGTDGSVTVLSKHLEMGQGAYTGLATLVAEELDADWASVRVEVAPANTDLYKNLALGLQCTGGSTAIANSYEQMRRAGATARAMLVAAAARQWQVDAKDITVSAGVVRHAATQRQAGFGDLAAAAAKLPVPESVPLKAAADFRLIGKEAPRRVDGLAKTDGTAIFTQDMKLPGMLVAMAAHPPRFGGKVASFDATKARAVPGVRHVVQFSGTGHNFEGVAVLADNTWAARTGRDALQVQWDDSQAY